VPLVAGLVEHFGLFRLAFGVFYDLPVRYGSKVEVELLFLLSGALETMVCQYFCYFLSAFGVKFKYF
jgi:hypothetical protein